MIAAAVIGSVHPAFAVIFGKIIGVSFLGFSFFLLFFSRRIGVGFFVLFVGFVSLGRLLFCFFVVGGGLVGFLFCLGVFLCGWKFQS